MNLKSSTALHRVFNFHTFFFSQNGQNALSKFVLQALELYQEGRKAKDISQIESHLHIDCLGGEK